MKNLTQKVRGGFFQFFLYFSAVVFLTAFSLGGALYLYFSNILEKDAIQTNNNLLKQIKNTEEFILAEVDKSFANVLLDPFFVDYMDYYRARNISLLMTIQSKLQNVVISNEYLDSVYIYYMQDNAILSSNMGYANTEDFYDRDFIGKITRGGIIPDNYVQTRIIQESFNRNNIKVLSFIKRIPTISVDTNKIMVVINVNAEYLQNAINTVALKSNSALVITSKNEQIIAQIANEAFPAEMALNQNAKITDIKDSASYKEEVSGIKSLVSVVFSAKHQWWYVYIVPMSIVTESIRLLGFMTISVCIAVLAMGIIWSFFFSKRLYSPIKTTFSLFDENRIYSESSLTQDGAHPKEIDVFQSKIKKLINRNRTLENMLAEYTVYQKNEFLKGLLNKDEDNLYKIGERLSFYDILLDLNSHYMAFVISMDNFDEFIKTYNEKQRNMLMLYVMENAADEVPPALYGFTVEKNSNEIVILLNIHNEEPSQAMKTRCYELAREIQKSASDNKKQTFTVGVSRLHKDVDSIPLCYEEASNALNYRFLQGLNQTILYENVGIDSKEEVMYPYHIEKKLLNSLKLRNQDDVINYLDDFAEYFYTSLSENAALVRTYFLQLLSTSMRCITEMDIVISTSIVEDGGGIYSNILNEHTMKGLIGQMESFYSRILKRSEDQHVKKNNELVFTIIKYIEGHLSDDLSIERLAEEFFISPSYIRKIFKEKTSRTIKGYTSELRMNQAKLLLEDARKPISDIASAVGYLSVPSFTTVFRLNTGKTPKEYRMSVMKSKKESAS